MIQSAQYGIKWSPIWRTFSGGEAARMIGYMSYVSEDFRPKAEISSSCSTFRAAGAKKKGWKY